MYMQWVKPYLKQIERLQLDQEKNESEDIISAFETSLIEVELMAKKPGGKLSLKGGEKKTKEFKQVILLHFLFRSSPQLQYHQEGYNRGPIHVGQMRVNFRAYVWDDEQIKDFREAKRREDLNLLKVIDGSVAAALDALGDELMAYLREAGDDVEERKTKDFKQEGKKPSMNPFTAITDIFTGPKKPKKPTSSVKPLTKNDKYLIHTHKKSQSSKVLKDMWGLYNHFKKRHALLNW
jgi:hypothetical protein